MIFKRALVSTSDKTGLVDFLQPLSKSGCEIVSTGGTSKYLRENGIPVKEVAEVTGFPEVMDGRVRTLHPKIHMGLLARSFVPEDFKLLKEHGVTPFDLVVVNLYPFAQALAKGLEGDELIEQIDIGGPSLLRAAAKSFERLTVVCEPTDYKEILSRAEEKTLDKTYRQHLAAKVFAHCSKYDSLIAAVLGSDGEKDADLPSHFDLHLDKKMSLRYGENPQQKAGFYSGLQGHPLSLNSADQKQGKELSYNNILDLEAAVSVVSEFEKPACVIIKHNTPCGVAVEKTIKDAYDKAFQADSVSAFGGIVALNRPVEEDLAQLLSGPFLECVIAPAFSEGALKALSVKKNLRLLSLPPLAKSDFKPWIEFKSLRGGFLVQMADEPMHWSADWKIIGPAPSEEMKNALLFAQRVVKHVKSNAIVIASGLQTIGICGGQTNRIDSVKMAIERAKQSKSQNWVLASDAFFPFRDSVDLAVKSGIKWIIQPGGSLRDQEVEAAARDHGITMVLTGKRHFRH